MQVDLVDKLMRKFSQSASPGLVVVGLGPAPQMVRRGQYGESRVILDHSTAKCSSAAHRAVRTDDGRLMACCDLRNRRPEALKIQVQTVFRDDTGLILPDQTNWETIVIPGNSISSYRCTSMSQDAARYNIRIRLAI